MGDFEVFKLVSISSFLVWFLFDRNKCAIINYCHVFFFFVLYFLTSYFYTYVLFFFFIFFFFSMFFFHRAEAWLVLMIAHSVDATERDAAGFSLSSSTPILNKGEIRNTLRCTVLCMHIVESYKRQLYSIE